MEKNKKAQGAMEYLMTYGWAVIVIIAIVVAMWYLGIFEPNQTGVITASGFSKIKPFEPSIVMTPDCNFSGIFLNGVGYTINVTDIVIHHMSENTDCSKKISGTGLFKMGEDIYVRQSGCCFSAHGAGESYVLKFKINYTGQVGGVPVEKVEEGYIYGVYVEHIQLKNCQDWYYGTSQQGHCCSYPKVCSPGHKLPAIDCSECCEGPGDTYCITPTTSTTTSITTTTTTTVTTTTTSTSSTITTTTTLGSISAIQICDSIYYCGTIDGICPTDFCLGCSCNDPDCI